MNKKLLFIIFFLVTGFYFADVSSASAAISYDTSKNIQTVTSTSLSYSYTVGTGNNRMLYVGVWLVNSPTGLGVTYNGVAMTEIDFRVNWFFGAGRISLFALPAPDEGTHNVVISVNTSQVIRSVAASYFGVAQTTTMDETDPRSGTATSVTNSLTTVADNTWQVVFTGLQNSRSVSAGTGSTLRTSTGQQLGFFDSNGPKTPAGSTSMQVNFSASAAYGSIMASMAPAAVSSTVTLATGTDPSNATLAPGASATMAGAFTLTISSGSDTATSVVVDLGSGAAAGISLVEITNDDGSTVYGSTAIPGVDDPTVTLNTNTLNISTSVVQYKIRITPRSHGNMPSVPGATYTVTAKISSVTTTNSVTGSDTAGTTITIDNASPANVTLSYVYPSNTAAGLGWTNPADSDFAEVVVLRRAGSAVSDVPVEGTTYVAGNTIGSSTVACVSSITGCVDLGLTNDTTYYYKVFAKDSNGNYSSGGVVPTGAPALIQEQTYYISPNGSDTMCNGLSSSAYPGSGGPGLTCAFASNSFFNTYGYYLPLGAGDTILYEAGVGITHDFDSGLVLEGGAGYSNGNAYGDVSNPITVSSYGTGNAHIVMSGNGPWPEAALSFYEVTGVEVYNLDLEGPSGGIEMGDTVSNLNIHDITFTGSGIGIASWSTVGTNVQLSDISMNSDDETGIYIDQSSGLDLNDIDIVAAGIGLRIEGSTDIDVDTADILSDLSAVVNSLGTSDVTLNNITAEVTGVSTTVPQDVIANYFVSDITITNSTITSPHTDTIGRSGIGSLVVDHLTIDTVTLIGPGATAAGGDYGIYFHDNSGSPGSADSIVIDNVDISGFYTGIQSFAGVGNRTFTNVIIRDSEIHDVKDVGIAAYSSDIDSPAWSNALIDNVDIYDITGVNGVSFSAQGIFLGGVEDVTIEDSRIYNIGTTAWDIESHGIEITIADNILVRRNTIHNVRGDASGESPGAMFDAEVTNSVMEYNYIYEIDGAGISVGSYNLGLTEDNIIRYNVIKNTGYKWGGGINIWNSYGAPNTNTDNNQVYNNTIYYSPSINDYLDGAIVISGITNNTIVKNNIMYTESGAPILQTYAGQVGIVLDYNLYYTEGSFNVEWEGNSYTSYAAFLAASSQEVNSVNADPQFVNIFSNNFSLSSTSPAIDVGVDLNSPHHLGLSPASVLTSSITTLDQDANGTGWEIGAYIYFPMAFITISGNAYEDLAGSTAWSQCGGTPNIALSIAGGAKANINCNASTGAFVFSNQVAATNDVVAIYFDTDGGDKAVLYTTVVDDSTDITSLDLMKNAILLRYETGSLITNAEIQTYDKTNDSDIPVNATSNNVAGDAGVTLVVDTSKTFSPNGDVTVSALQIKGTYNGRGETTTVGDLTIDSGGTFYSSKTLNLTGNITNNGTYNGASQTGGGSADPGPVGDGTSHIYVAPTTSTTISGSNGITFDDFTVQASAGANKSLIFKGNTTYTFAGDFSVSGNSSSPLSISSTVGGQQWTATFQGNTTATYVSVRDSTCTGGTTFGPDINIRNRGNNGACWRFFIIGGGGGSGAVSGPTGGTGSGGGSPVGGGDDAGGGTDGSSGSGGGNPVGGGGSQGGGGGGGSP